MMLEIYNCICFSYSRWIAVYLNFDLWFIVCMIIAIVYYKWILTEQTVNFLPEASASDLGQTIAILPGIFFDSCPTSCDNSTLVLTFSIHYSLSDHTCF